ncbi:hypothetical protein CBR_g34253 [Chara braunii]|uniref:HAT C-terminal dimerisation domain-containing protein n=1 Tax=Chara braunii TaxID=69332 RepID=A0A388JYI8_CHABU|nr:hypothetical protein CBR_g34253 [Chara braunii]|eukprot:GBG62881.1 hypothetical protein CBR_g34253 [Chara braunii]
MLHDDAWDKIPWESSKRRQALWVRHLIRCADFWRNVQHAVAVMTPVHQLLRRLDWGGMIMSTMYSWSQELVRQVAAADVPDDMRGPCVEAVQIRTMHMLELAHAAAHLLNPRRRSIRYYESACRTAADLEVVTECDSFLLAQTGGDRAGDAYLRVREQMRSFHSRVGHHTERVMRDAEAEACVGDEETSRCASWWVEHGACFPDLQEIAGRVMHMWTSASPAERNWAEHERIHTAKRNKLEFRKVVQLVEIATNLKLLGCSERSGGYVLSWGHMATLAEAQREEYTHPVVADEDEEEEPEPEEWRARPQTAVPAHEIAAQASEEQTDTEVGEDLPPGVDKSAERLYYTYGGGADGFQPRCTFIRESDDDPIPATDIGLDGGQRDEDDADDDDDDDESLLLRRARREASDHLHDIRDEEHLPSQHKPASALRGDSQQRELRTSDFQGLGPGFAGSGVRGRADGRERVGDEAEYHPVQGGGPESVEELHARMDREEEQRLQQLQREWVGRDKYMAEQQRARDLETGTVVRDVGGVEHSIRTVPHGFPADAAIPDTAVPETSPQGDVDSGSAVGGELGASEYGDPTVSDIIVGLCAAGTLQQGDPVSQEAVPMDDDSGELDGGRLPDAEGNDGAGDVDRLAPAYSTGPGRSTHGSIGVDACGPVQGDAHVDDAGGNMSWALVLRHPSPVAHEDASHPAEGGVGVDDAVEGGTADDRTNPKRADREEGEITPGLLDPDALHRAAMEDPIITRPAGFVGVVVRSPPPYTPLSPLYAGSPASLEREQQRSESIRAAASGARTTRIPPVTPPPPTTVRGSPTTVTGRERERGHMSSSSSPRLDTQQSLHRSWSIV